MNKFDKALRYEIFEKKEYQCLDNFIKNSELILDIGGYKGYFSLYCLSINPNLKIHFFEPINDFGEEAKINLKNNEDIIWNNFGVWNKNEVKKIWVEKQKGMQSSIYKKNFMLKDFEVLNANFVDLNLYLDKLDKVCLMKMDIEGAEFEVLASLSLSNLVKIKTLFLEYHLIDNFDENDLKKLLDKLGQIYNNVSIWENEYSSKLGYILCN